MIVNAVHVSGRHRPSHVVRLPHGPHRMWTVREQPVTSHRRSRRVLMQLSVADLVHQSRPRELPRPWWRRTGSFLAEWFLRVVEP